MMPKNLRAGALALALILISLVFFVLGCGGGGSDPVNVPVDPNHDSDDPQSQIQYRLYVLDLPDGGQIITDLYARQGVNTPWEIRYDFREIGDVNWSPVAQDATLDVTIEGAPSGHKMPDIGLTGGQYRIRGGTYRLEVAPLVGGELGSTFLVLRIKESGASARVSITILPPSGDGSGQSCEELHPNAPEIIDGNKWDCVGGIWTNLGSVNPPPPDPDKDIFPLVANPTGYYSGQGQQSLTLELQPIPSGVGWINWEIPAGPSGAFTVPLGMPQVQCEFYYTACGTYTIRATPYESESSFDTGGSPIGDYATFMVSIIAG